MYVEVKTFTYFSHVFHGFIVNGSRIYTLFKNPLLLYNSRKTVDFYQFSWHWCDIPLYHGSAFVWFGKVWSLCMPWFTNINLIAIFVCPINFIPLSGTEYVVSYHNMSLASPEVFIDSLLLCYPISLLSNRHIYLVCWIYFRKQSSSINCGLSQVTNQLICKWKIRFCFESWFETVCWLKACLHGYKCTCITEQSQP